MNRPSLGDKFEVVGQNRWVRVGAIVEYDIIINIGCGEDNEDQARFLVDKKDVIGIPQDILKAIYPNLPAAMWLFWKDLEAVK